MGEQQGFLTLPTTVAIGEILLSEIEEATKAGEALRESRDTEALHDFRVAVRRLRSQLRAYRPWLGGASKRKVRRRWRKLAAASNSARDAEVQLAAVEKLRVSLTRGERSGLNWLTKRLRANRRGSYATVRHEVSEQYPPLARALTDHLRELAVDAPPLGATLVGLIRDHAADLEALLPTIRSAADRKAIHEARISAKRLRYLLEPIRRDTPHARPVVKAIKQLQDLLGELHDEHVLETTLDEALDEVSREKSSRMRDFALAGKRAELQRERRRDERLGIVALAALVRTRRDRLYEELATVWLARRAGETIRDARDLATSLAPPRVEGFAVHDEPAATAVAEETWKPPMERERKFLLTQVPDFATTAPVKQIEQGWVPGKTLHERLRRTTEDGVVRYFRTIKLGKGIERIEIEEETTADVFDTMWPLTERCRLSKKRYSVPDGELLWEIDVFDDRDLVLAEVELEAADQESPFPEWLAPCVEREVTGETAYLNLTLASQAA